MALKYERFIVKMSLEQKLKLITSTEFYKSSPVDSYEIPTFDIKKQPYGEDNKGLHITHFPNDVALSAAWNPALVEEVYAAAGQEAHAVNSFAYYNTTNDIGEEGVTDDYFLLSKFVASKVAGLRRGNGYVNFVDVPTEDTDEAIKRRAVRDTVLFDGKPDSLVINDVEELEVARQRFKYGDMVYGVVSTVDEALDFLYSGASFLFLAEDIFAPLLNRLKTLTNAYKQAYAKYVNDKLPESSFARLVRNFKIFNTDIIDKACDDVINVVYSMKSAEDDESADFKSLKRGESAKFDEINHNALSVTAARQSAVLIKNDGNILPVDRSVRLAVMGEYAKDLKYQREYYYTRATSEKLAFDAINDYELNAVGFALGYAKGEHARTDLIDHALSLIPKSDCVLMYLCANKGANRLPSEQLELIDLVAGRGAKIIAVVAAEGNIDLGFADKCAAVLLTFVAGQGGASAVLDLITGEVSPSGKLPFPMGLIGADGTISPRYLTGHGLSYTRFAYENLKVNESGVSFTVKNVGENDGYAVPQLFVKKKNTTTVFANKVLKGYKKVFVAKGDGVRVKIPFDELTFSVYEEGSGYKVEGGLYTISIGETADEDKLSGVLLLKDYEEKHSFKSSVVETSDDGRALDFTERNLPSDVKETRKKLPFGLKVALAVMLAVYVDAVLALFAFSKVIANKDFVFYLIIIAAALIVNGLIIGYICVVSTQRKREKYIPANTVLTDMLDNVDEFTEIAKVKYKTPVEEAKQEEEQKAEQEAEQEAEQQEIAAAYEVNFDTSAQADVQLSARTSFSELCANLKDFARQHGINIEASSTRVLMGAIASCKLVFLTSKNAELLPRFVNVLNEYLGNETVVTANDEWRSLSDLLWNEGDGKYVLSPFSNAVYAAYTAKERESAVIIDNVNINNLGSYFFKFLEYANHPTEKYVINFNDETSFQLPDNLTYILVPQNGAVDAIPQEILNASLVAEVMISQAEPIDGETVEPKILAHEDFKLLLSESKEVSFVSEKIWKKVDELAETLSATERFAIGNKNTIQMESFTSVIMDCGAEEPEAVTQMFLGKLAYILKNTRAYRADGGEKNVYALVEKLFPDAELNKIKRALTKTLVQPKAEQTARPAGNSAEEVGAASDGQGAAGQSESTEQVGNVSDGIATGEQSVATGAESAAPYERDAAGQPKNAGQTESVTGQPKNAGQTESSATPEQINPDGEQE